jgi:hypothetical protein
VVCGASPQGYVSGGLGNGYVIQFSDGLCRIVVPGLLAGVILGVGGSSCRAHIHPLTAGRLVLPTLIRGALTSAL